MMNVHPYVLWLLKVIFSVTKSVSFTFIGIGSDKPSERISVEARALLLTRNSLESCLSTQNFHLSVTNSCAKGA